MLRRVAYLAVALGLALMVGGCALNFIEPRQAWRGQEERACLSAGLVRETAFIQRARKINGRGSCGIDRPLQVRALAGGRIALGPEATLGCPMTAAIERWLQTSVQPAAVAWFGMPVTGLRQISNYSCRTRNNAHGAKLSEHAFGNALDIAAFTLADGRTLTVKGDYLHGPPDAQGFLREVYAGACAQFKTVLGPGARYHGDHFHLDLAHHNDAGTSRYCKPTPSAPVYRQPYGNDRVARSEPGAGPLLGEEPADVAADLADPFGVATMRASPSPPAGVPLSYAP